MNSTYVRAVCVCADIGHRYIRVYAYQCADNVYVWRKDVLKYILLLFILLAVDSVCVQLCQSVNKSNGQTKQNYYKMN